MLFHDILRLLIEERGLTQKQTAIDLHIPVSTMGGYVQGVSEPDFATLKLLAEYFDVTTDYLLNFRSGKTETQEEDELLRIFRSLTHIISGAGQSLFEIQPKRTAKIIKVDFERQK